MVVQALGLAPLLPADLVFEFDSAELVGLVLMLDSAELVYLI